MIWRGVGQETWKPEGSRGRVMWGSGLGGVRGSVEWMCGEQMRSWVNTRYLLTWAQPCYLLQCLRLMQMVTPSLGEMKRQNLTSYGVWVSSNECRQCVQRDQLHLPSLGRKPEVVALPPCSAVYNKPSFPIQMPEINGHSFQVAIVDGLYPSWLRKSPAFLYLWLCVLSFLHSPVDPVIFSRPSYVGCSRKSNITAF